MHERIKQLRKERKLTQIEFAKSIGIAQSSLSEIEKGTIPSAEILISICKQYEVSADWILFGTQNSNEIINSYKKLNLEEKDIVDMIFEKAKQRGLEHQKVGNL